MLREIRKAYGMCNMGSITQLRDWEFIYCRQFFSHRSSHQWTLSVLYRRYTLGQSVNLFSSCFVRASVPVWFWFSVYGFFPVEKNFLRGKGNEGSKKKKKKGRTLRNNKGG